MPETALAPTVPTIDAQTVERVLLHGDLSRLTPQQKISYYGAVCDSVGLNRLTAPFQYLRLPDGKEILYAKREATEQLRRLHDVSIDPKSFTREVIEGVYVVTAAASLPSGRTDVSTGAVAIDGLKGEARANAMMKAETKAKRRATLSICGLGMLDEAELDGIPGAEPVVGPTMSDYATVVGPPPADDEPAALPPPGFVLITRVDSAPTKNKNVTRYRVTTSSGDVLSTINSLLASVAETAARDAMPVRVQSKSTQWGDELTGIERQDTAPTPPPTADEIPF